MSDIPEATRRQIRERAGNRCEYCLSHQDYIMGRLQIDHIQPVAKDGSDDDDNLCLACELCNQHKWTKTPGIDPDTGQEVALFHPDGNAGPTILRGEQKGWNSAALPPAAALQSVPSA